MISKDLLIVLIIGASIRIFGMLILDLGEWDERFHANVAKNFLENPIEPYLIKDSIVNLENSDWSQTDVWIAKPPLALWFTSLGIYIFGPNELGLRVFSLIFSLLSIIFVYKIGKSLYNHTVGILAAFFYSINGLLYRINIGNLSGDHVDTLLNLIIFLIVFHLINNRKKQNPFSPFIFGILLGAAFLVKWSMIFLLIPFFLIVLYLNSNLSVRFLAESLFSFIIISFPWVFFMYHKYPSETNQMINGLISPVYQSIQGHSGNWYFYIDKIRIYINELVYLPFLFIIYFYFKKRTYNRSVLVFWILIPMIILSISATKREVYLSIFAVPLFISQSVFIMYLWKNRSKFRYKKFTYFIVSLIFLLALRFSIERLKFDQPRLTKPEYRQNFEQELKVKFFNNIENTVIVNEPKYMELRYYYGIKAYRYLEDSIIHQIKLKGFEVYSNNDGSYKKI